MEKFSKEELNSLKAGVSFVTGNNGASLSGGNCNLRGCKNGCRHGCIDSCKPGNKHGKDK
jgi:hypothetical protein